MKRLVHVVPIGGSEPVHEVHQTCWCFPVNDHGVMIHNASDCRESKERNGIPTLPDSVWATVYQKLEP